MREPFRFCIPIVREPFTQEECVIMIANPVENALNAFGAKIPPSHMTLIGRNRKGQLKQFVVSLKAWNDAIQNPAYFMEVPRIEAPSLAVDKSTITRKDLIP